MVSHILVTAGMSQALSSFTVLVWLHVFSLADDLQQLHTPIVAAWFSGWTWLVWWTDSMSIVCQLSGFFDRSIVYRRFNHASADGVPSGLSRCSLSANTL